MFSKLFPKEEVQPDGSRSRRAGGSRTTAAGSIRIQYPIGSLRIQLRRRFLERNDFFTVCPGSLVHFYKNGQDFLNVQLFASDPNLKPKFTFGLE